MSCKNRAVTPRLRIISFAFCGFAAVAAAAIDLRAACTGSSPNWTSTADRASVATCVTNAASGDTIAVQAGNAAWTSPIALPDTKDLTLQGATIVNCTGTPGADDYACAATDNTVLTCASACFAFNLGATQRITGFTFRTTTGDEVVSCAGEQSASDHFRVDHNHMLSTAGWAPIRCKGQTNGVHPQGIWDHNRLEDVALHTNGTLHQLSEGNYQHQIWAQNTPLGDSAAVVYIEDNHFSGGSNNINATDGNYGGRVVIRGNRLSGQTYMEFHSPQGENRGFQRWEVYNNILKDPSTTDCYFGLASIRGGTGVFFNNQMSGDVSDCNFDLLLDNVRSEWSAPVDGVGPCDGGSPWDQNTGGQQGWHCRDQIGTARDLAVWNHNTMPAWNQEIKPAYFWSNTKPPAATPITVSPDTDGLSDAHIQPNRDFYAYTAGFNGASGVGVGTLAQRPANCTTGVAFWATDQGEWNSLNAGTDGQLYKCTGANTWSLYYTPYAYPHPWASGGSAPGASVIDDDRRIDWEGHAGVPGGIPSGRTNCVTSACNTLFGGNVTAATINAAIASAPNNTVVRVPAGDFTLSAPIDFNLKSRVTLRGAGPGTTILRPGNIGAAITSGQTGAFGSERAITAGATKGSTSITVANASGIQAGTIVNIYQDADPAFYWTRDPGYRQDHTGQFAMVAAVSGNVLTLEDPLVWTYNLNPRLKPETLAGMRWSGIEDLTLTADAAFDGEFIQFWNTYACWIKNVETAWGNGNSHIQLYAALRNEIRDSYIHDTHSTTDGYGILTGAGWSGDRAGSTGLLIENNIFSGLWHGMILETEVGSVIAYNYLRNHRYTGWPNYQVSDINANHGGHVWMNLYEGNVAVGFQSDGYHGSSSHLTLFRNWFSGQHVDSNRTGNVKTVDLCRYTRYSSVVGNVLGFSGWPRTTNGRYEMTGQPGYPDQTVIYRLGYPNMGNNGYSDVNPPSDGEDGGLDPLTESTLLRWGNFDYQNNAVRWETSEIPAGHSTPPQTLPASLFYSATPWWWPSASAWPPIGPDVSGRVTDIPAKYCFDQNQMPNCLSGGAAPAGTIIVGAATYSVNEPAGSVVISVNRASGSSGAVGVSYATSSGTASAGSDYTAASGTLSWADGDGAAKTITINVMNDSAVEGTETFSLSLSNPTGGAALGSVTTATISILDDEAPPDTTPPLAPKRFQRR